MRPLLAALACASCLASAEVTIGQWNGMLVVSAPSGHDLSRLGGRLDQRITLDARDQSLSDTAEFLRRATGLNIVLAPALTANPPVVNLQVREMELGSLLTWLEKTASIHIGFVSGALYVSDKPVAGTVSTRLYDVSDLALPIRDFPGPEMTVPEPGGTGASILPPIETASDGATRYDLDQLSELLNRLVNKD